MKINEIKKTVEQVVRVEYVAEDGTVFYNKEECEKYEESALFAIKKELRKLNKNHYTTLMDLYGTGSEEDEVEIFDIQTERDLENLKRYIYLTMKKNGACDSTIADCFEIKKDSYRNDYVIDSITPGHEVIICWGYDKDWVWTKGDGSIDGYLSVIRKGMENLIKTDVTE